MSLLSITADFSTLVSVLREISTLLLRLVQAVERVSPVLPSPDEAPPVYQAQPQDVHAIDDEAQELARAGEFVFAERYGVVPGSPAFRAAMADYEREMRRVYGDDTTIDWPEVFKTAARAVQD